MLKRLLTEHEEHTMEPSGQHKELGNQLIELHTLSLNLHNKYQPISRIAGCCLDVVNEQTIWHSHEPILYLSLLLTIRDHKIVPRAAQHIGESECLHPP